MKARLNGTRVASWAPARVTRPLVSTVPTGPRCPKHCDTSTPPEHGGGDQWLCICCGTQFTWKGKPS